MRWSIDGSSRLTHWDRRRSPGRYASELVLTPDFDRWKFGVRPQNCLQFISNNLDLKFLSWSDPAPPGALLQNPLKDPRPREQLSSECWSRGHARPVATRTSARARRCPDARKHEASTKRSPQP